MRLLRMVWIGSVFMALGLVPSVSVAQEAPKNLQFFSADIGRDSLISVMRGFSLSLGVRCQYCHTGGDGRSFEGVVFENDDDPDKRKARFMLRMVETINNSMLPMMADRDEPNAEVTCKTCHRGLPRPALLTDLLRATLDEHGTDSTKAEYERLRESSGMAGVFDFGEWEVNTLAERLVAEGRPRDAIAIYELNLEHYPESVSILFGLAQLHERVGEVGNALRYYDRVLEVMPDNPQARARIEALRG